MHQVHNLNKLAKANLLSYYYKDYLFSYNEF